MGKAIDLALHSGNPLDIPGFKKKPGTVIPHHMGWLLERIFTTDGYVRNDADVTALRHTRQLVYWVYKLNIPYGKETENKVLDSFIATEQELLNLVFPAELDPIIKRARTALTRLFSGFCPRNIVPRHGPGAVATGEQVGEKSNFSRLYSKLDREYPFTEYFTVGLSQIADQLDWIRNLEVLEHATAKVVLVPKDSRGPRIISCEPLELQWIQQGLQKALYSWVESHRYTKGHVNFTDQSINRRLALVGSRTGKYVTLDMKDASDRVSVKLVESLFCGTSLLQALMACRSDSTRLPDGTVIALSKFAPMGSAVCFPIEALCFWALAVSVLVHHGVRWRDAIANVWVYGDDIIVRREDYPLLLTTFPKVGLKFNQSKCCTGGFFRESCGCDAFKGVDVSPVRLRTRWNQRNTRSASELVSYVALSNALWRQGYWGASDEVKAKVEGRYGPIPFASHSEVVEEFDTLRRRLKHYQIPGRIGSIPVFQAELTETEQHELSVPIAWVRSHVNHHSANKVRGIKSRFNGHLHRIEYRTWTVQPVKRKFNVDSWKEMLRVLNAGSIGSSAVGPFEDPGTYTLPRRSCLKRGWSQIP